MKVLKPDHERLIKLDGVANPVPRPVDIDQAQTGFRNLRTLRIYQFEPDTVIDGHAEEDEVFIIVLSGEVELSMTGDGVETGAVRMSAAIGVEDDPCAAYLPPHGAYRLLPKSKADVAYVRATPKTSRAPKFFSSPRSGAEVGGVRVLLDESGYAEKLAIRLVNVAATSGEFSWAAVAGAAQNGEALLHLRAREKECSLRVSGADSEALLLRPWDTLAFRSVEQPTFGVAERGAQILTVVARV
jgi:5-keto 4-deoxyuronate isomerase family protein